MLNFLRKKKLETVFGQNNRKRRFINYDNIKNIMLIFNIDDFADVKHIVSALEEDGKKVVSWTVSVKDKNNLKLPEDIRVIDSSRDISWSQFLSQSIMDEFNSQYYDTFFDLTTSEDVILNYLLAMNKSRFCVGIKNNDFRQYDFVVYKQEDITLLETYNHLKHYLGHVYAG